jgi:predicted SprT family Zn-dependent metalloprotease
MDNNKYYRCPECQEYLSKQKDIDKNKLPMSWYECEECGWSQLWIKK